MSLAGDGGEAKTTDQNIPSLPRHPRVADYIARYPALGPLEEVSTELIAQEYYVRHRWRDMLADFRGWRYTQTNGGQFAAITVTAKKQTMLFAATTKAAAPTIAGWDETNDGFHYTDQGRTEMRIVQRDIEQGQTITVPQGGWTGTLLLIPPVAK